jgi:hypothetical protein
LAYGVSIATNHVENKYQRHGKRIDGAENILFQKNRILLSLKIITNPIQKKTHPDNPKTKRSPNAIFADFDIICNAHPRYKMKK